MTTTDILLIISAVTTSMIALMTPVLAVVVKRIEFKQTVNRTTSDADKVSTDDKLKEIHTLVDGSLSATTATNVALVKENQSQKEVITRLTPAPESESTLTQKVAELQAELARLKSNKPDKSV